MTIRKRGGSMAGVSLKFRVLMALSGATGLSMFVLANFYLNAYPELKLATALTQIAVNAFVFVSWFGGFRQATPRTLTKLVALIGFIVPCCMASITLVRVVLPCAIEAISKT